MQSPQFASQFTLGVACSVGFDIITTCIYHCSLKSHKAKVVFFKIKEKRERREKGFPEKGYCAFHSQMFV